MDQDILWLDSMNGRQFKIELAMRWFRWKTDFFQMREVTEFANLWIAEYKSNTDKENDYCSEIDTTGPLWEDISLMITILVA